MPRRSKIDYLPAEIKSELDRLLIEQAFSDYRGLEVWLEERGFEIGKSSIHRYGKEFKGQLDSLRLATEQAKAIADVCGDEENALGDALSRLAQQRAFDLIQDFDPTQAEPLSFDRLVNAISNLNKSANQTKKHSKQMRSELERVSEEVVQQVQSAGLSESAAAEIREKILGVGN
jgi:flagellar hook-basal body complex protein FliE